MSSYVDALGKIQTNTNGVFIPGEDAGVQFSYWNGVLSVKIMQKIAQPVESDGRKYDSLNVIRLSVTARQAVTLGYAILDEIIPASLQNKPAFKGIVTLKSNVLVVSNGIKEYGKLSPYIAGYCDINTNYIPAKKKIVKVEPERIFDDFNTETGEHVMREEYISVLKFLATFLINTIQLTGAVGHNVEESIAYREITKQGLLKQMAQKHGLDSNSLPREGSLHNKVETVNWSTPINDTPSPAVMATSSPTADTMVSGSLDDLESLI